MMQLNHATAVPRAFTLDRAMDCGFRQARSQTGVE
jgi:hypothetical protein